MLMRPKKTAPLEWRPKAMTMLASSSPMSLHTPWRWTIGGLLAVRTDGSEASHSLAPATEWCDPRRGSATIRPSSGYRTRRARDGRPVSTRGRTRGTIIAYLQPPGSRTLGCQGRRAVHHLRPGVHALGLHRRRRGCWPYGHQSTRCWDVTQDRRSGERRRSGVRPPCRSVRRSDRQPFLEAMKLGQGRPGHPARKPGGALRCRAQVRDEKCQGGGTPISGQLRASHRQTRERRAAKAARPRTARAGRGP